MYGVQVEVFNALGSHSSSGSCSSPGGVALGGRDGRRAEDPPRGRLRARRDELQVSTRIVVPAAISGVVAAFMLAFARAVGETMIVLIAAGQLPQITFDPRGTIETMTAFIAQATGGDVPTGSIEYKTIFAVGLTLFVITYAINLLSDPAHADVQGGVRVSERSRGLEDPAFEGDALRDAHRVRDARRSCSSTSSSPGA